MCFHKLPEEGRIHEIETVGYFFDTFVRMLQFVLDASYGVLIDDGQWALPADFLDNGRQVLGCVAELVGIVGYRTVTPVVFGHFLHKLAEDIHGAVVAKIGDVFLIGDGSMKSAQQLAESSREEMLLGFLAVGMFLVVDAS